MMITTRIVIFVFTAGETELAIKYKKIHPESDVKIVIGSTSAQLVLLRNSVYAFDYLELFNPLRKSYRKRVGNLRKQSIHIFETVSSRLTHLQAFGINQIEVLRLLLEPEFLDVVSAYQLFRMVKLRWRPHRYVFFRQQATNFTGWDITYFSAAKIMADYFCNTDEVVYLNSDEKKLAVFRWKCIRNILQSPERLQKIAVMVILRLFDSVKHLSYSGSGVDFLLFSAGSNLFYYRSLFAANKKNKLKLSHVTVTGGHTLENEWLLRNAQMDYVPLNMFDSKGLMKQVELEHTVFKRSVSKTLHDPTVLKNLFPRYLPEMLKKVLLFKLNWILSKYSKKFIRQTALAKKTILQTRPKLVITTHDPSPSALPFVLLAKQFKLPTLVLMHGFYDLSFGTNHQSDFMASWGKEFKNKFVNLLDKNPNTIHSTGFPYFDQYLTNRVVSSRHKKTTYHQPLRLSLLLTIYQIDPFVVPHFMYELFNALAKANLQIKVLLRTHPGQDMGSVQELGKYFEIQCTYDSPSTPQSLDEFILNGDIIYSWDTTAILWAALYRKPLFYSTPWWGEGYMPIKKFRAGWVPDNSNDFIRQLKLLIHDPSLGISLREGQKRFLKHVLGVTDGTSTEKLGQLIQKLTRYTLRT